MTAGNPLLDAALDYAARGWKLLPLRPRGKVPLLDDWQHQASSDPEVVRRWWARWPDANVGVQLGPRSGLIDVECDGPEAEAALVDLLGLPAATLVTQYKSKRGTHRLFAWSPNLPSPDKAVFKWRGVEFRTGNGDKGAQSVFPPSVHPDGPTIFWVVAPDDCPPGAVPGDAVRRLHKEAAAANGKHSRRPPPRGGQGGGGKITEPGRNDWLTSSAGSLRRYGASEATILAALRDLNRERCDPPLGDDEVASIARGVAGRYPPASEEEVLRRPAAPPPGADPAAAVSGALDWLRKNSQVFAATGVVKVVRNGLEVAKFDVHLANPAVVVQFGTAKELLSPAAARAAWINASKQLSWPDVSPTDWKREVNYINMAAIVEDDRTGPLAQCAEWLDGFLPAALRAAAVDRSVPGQLWKAVCDLKEAGATGDYARRGAFRTTAGEVYLSARAFLAWVKSPTCPRGAPSRDELVTLLTRLGWQPAPKGSGWSVRHPVLPTVTAKDAWKAPPGFQLPSNVGADDAPPPNGCAVPGLDKLDSAPDPGYDRSRFTEGSLDNDPCNPQ